MTERHAGHVSRREFVHLGAIGGACLGVPALGLRPGWLRDVAREAGPIDVADAAARWIRGHGVRTAAGLTWPRVPGQDSGGDLGLYHGSPGVVLFLLELHARTGDDAALEDAHAGARELAAALTRPDPIQPGLYSGLAGMAYALDLAGESTGDAELTRAARTCVDRIVSTARTLETGVAWFDEDPENASSDIVSGASGIGLTLLWYADRHAHDAATDTAIRAADHLATLGMREADGLKWRMMPSFERTMPNFSHGTAGVATFLAAARKAGGDAGLLDAAIAGARYLEAISICEGGACWIFHHEPEGEDLFYLSWCHGPPGTARLFYQLAETTGDDGWRGWLERGAAAVRSFGVPETRSDGYWNNISQCCGDAGVGEYALALHAMTGDDAHLEYARRIADWIQGRADDPGSDERRWTQAEHRAQPELLEAQTGWMQGAAGVGSFFLHLDARQHGESPLVSIPDTPWSGAL